VWSRESLGDSGDRLRSRHFRIRRFRDLGDQEGLLLVARITPLQAGDSTRFAAQDQFRPVGDRDPKGAQLIVQGFGGIVGVDGLAQLHGVTHKRMGKNYLD